MRGPAHCLLIIGSVYLLTLPAHGDDPSFLSKVSHVGTVAPTSTVLDNFDVNPYGIAVAPVTTGALVANSVLDYRSLIIYTIITSSILYFQRNTTGAALISSKY